MMFQRFFLVIVALAFFGLLPVLAAEGEMQATITEVSKDGILVTAHDDLQGYQFRVDDLTQVKVNDKEGKLADLKPGDSVTIKHAEEQEGAPRAFEIRVERK